MSTKIGVLALQGAFLEHLQILQVLKVECAPIRLPGELIGLNGLIIPGGESTTIMHLMKSFDLVNPIKEMAGSGIPIWGTCAGMICLASCISDSDMETLAVMDMEVRRNAFGRQIDSFETRLDIPEIGPEPYSAIFIRSPLIEKVGEKVKVLAEFNGKPVSARQNNLLATAFHPELTTDHRFHSYFLRMASGC